MSVASRPTCPKGDICTYGWLWVFVYGSTYHLSYMWTHIQHPYTTRSFSLISFIHVLFFVAQSVACESVSQKWYVYIRIVMSILCWSLYTKCGRRTCEPTSNTQFSPKSLLYMWTHMQHHYTTRSFSQIPLIHGNHLNTPSHLVTLIPPLGHVNRTQDYFLVRSIHPWPSRTIYLVAKSVTSGCRCPKVIIDGWECCIWVLICTSDDRFVARWSKVLLHMVVMS